jgi:hypothetical protein
MKIFCFSARKTEVSHHKMDTVKALRATNKVAPQSDKLSSSLKTAIGDG